jgi:acetyl-CoA acetyltransferase
VAGPDASLLTQPSRAILAACERAGKTVKDISLFELNEAFAAVGASVPPPSAVAAARATPSSSSPSDSGGACPLASGPKRPSSRQQG